MNGSDSPVKSLGGLARRVLSEVQRMVPPARSGTVVLAYHLVNAGTDSPVDLDEATFRRQLEILRDECEVVSLDEALASPAAMSPRPRVVLTFDDAFLNFRQVAWPLLQAHGLPATLYVPVGFVEGTHGSPIRGTSLPACGWNDLLALRAEGAHIGSHSVSHVNLRRAPLAAVRSELRESRSELEGRLGCPVTSFCYPQAKWSRPVGRAVRDVYDSAVTAGGVRWHPGRTPRHRIPRFPLKRDGGDFRALLQTSVWLPELVAHGARQWIA